MYRDRPPSCPRCRIELERPAAAESWRCAACGGVLVATQELVRAIVEVEPSLVPDAGVKGLRTIGRATLEAALRCGFCERPMEPVFLGGEPIDRCYVDEVLWLDHGERDAVLASARAQRREPPSWLRRIFG